MEYPTYYETIMKSDIFKEWTKYAEDNLLFDMPESIECGCLSDKHWEAFIEFVKTKGREEISNVSGWRNYGVRMGYWDYFMEQTNKPHTKPCACNICLDSRIKSQN